MPRTPGTPDRAPEVGDASWLPSGHPRQTIDGCPSSVELCQELAAAGKPVMLAFSRGKDSLAAYLHMRAWGIDVRPFFMHPAPVKFSFVESSLAWYEEFFQTRIRRYYRPMVYGWIAAAVQMPPEYLRVVDALAFQIPGFDLINFAFCDDEGLDFADTLLADGVRAADSPNRRRAFVKYFHDRWHNQMRVSPVWDFRLAEVWDIIRLAGAKLPIDYKMFGKTVDGLDHRYMAPLARHFPDDWRRLLEWFPMLELELMRYDIR